MHGPQRDIYIALVAADDAKAIDIGKLVEALLFLFHLAPNGIGALFTTAHIGIDPGGIERDADIIGDARDQVAVFAHHRL